MSLVYGSVCSGIEAASVAWKPLGWRGAFLSEIEPFPRAVLAHHYPETPLHGDFTTIQAGEYEPIDLLVGGTPCQSFSVAGLRGGLDDDRGNLALEYLRLAQRLRPRWLVWENVPGVLSSNGGRDFGSILGGMGELGYGVAYRVLDAQFFGVAQRRRRVFVVGYLGDWRRAAAVLFERDSLSGDPAPSRLAVEVPTRTLAGGARKRGGYSYDDIPLAAVPIAYGITRDAIDRSGEGAAQNATERAGLGIIEEQAQTIKAKGPGAVAFALRGRDEGALPEMCGNGDVAGALRAAGGGSSRDYVAFSLTPASGKNGGIQAIELPVANTLTGTAEAAKNGRGLHLLRSSAVRRLTPRECERLQGFPDDYTAIPYRNGIAADGPRYKALGNSMAVPVMAWIGQRIAAVEAIIQQDLTPGDGGDIV